MVKLKVDLTPVKDEDDPADQYPPKGTPETALIMNLDECAYAVLHHTGRYFHGQIACAGYWGEEIGISDVPTNPGVWMFEGGKPWEHQDWESGMIDETGISGTFRKATPEDFENADIECPMDLEELYDQCAGG